MKTIAPTRILKEARELPVEKYDLILNDFDCITALACQLKKIPSIQFGHQASFQSANTPRPEVKSSAGEWILKNYAKASNYIGLHFDHYDRFILPPVIKKEIASSDPVDEGHVTVYLPSYCLIQLQKQFSKFHGQRFEIFCHQVTRSEMKGNITWMPVSKVAFDESLVTCTGIITGGGFETPAEALFLGKKLIAIPIQGQYEQNCNGAALKKLGVTVIEKLDEIFEQVFSTWINQPSHPALPFVQSTGEIMETVMEMANSFNKEYEV